MSSILPLVMVLLAAPVDGMVSDTVGTPMAQQSSSSASAASTSVEYDAPVRLLISSAVGLLADGRESEALALLTKARALVPADSWFASVIAGLERVGQSQMGCRSDAGEGRSLADLETVAEMYLHLTGFGFWTGLWGLGTVAELNDRIVVPGAVLTAGAGVGVAYFLDHRERPLSGGTAAAINYGLQWGSIYAGLGLASADAGWSDRANASTVWAAGALGGLAAGLTAETLGATRGDMALVYSGSLWGGVLGVTTGLSAGLLDNEAQGGPRAFLIGSLLGLGTSSWLASAFEVSRVRSIFIDLGGAGGSLIAFGIAALADIDSSQALGGLLTGGMVGGLGLAAYLTRDMDMPSKLIASAQDRGSPTPSWHVAPMLLASTAGMQGSDNAHDAANGAHFSRRGRDGKGRLALSRNGTTAAHSSWAPGVMLGVRW